MSQLARIARSYRTRVALSYVAVIALLALAWVASLFGPLNDVMRGQQEEMLASVARMAAYDVGRSPADVQSITTRIGSQTKMRVTVIGADGNVVADSVSDPARMENHATRPEVRDALKGRTGSDLRRSATQGTVQLYVAVPGNVDGATVAVRVSEPVRTIDAAAGRARSAGLLALLLAVILATFVAWRLSVSATRSLEDLADAAHRMAAGDLTVRIAPAAGETGTLAQALEDLRGQMRARLAHLEAERADLRALLDGLAEAVFLLENDHVAVANRAAGVLFRAPVGGWAGRDLDDRTLPASVAEAVRRAAKSGVSDSIALGPDPLGRHWAVTYVPLPSPAGTPDGSGRALVIVADTTERSRLDAMRTDFVANASHELKTPTSAIQLLAEAAGAAAEDHDAEQALAFLAQIRSETDKLRRLVLDLLDLSRLETTPEPDSVADVRSAVDLSVTGHGPAARAASLKLTADLAAVRREDVYVKADRTDVLVALDNLIDNAIAYTERGSVTVTVAADAQWVTLAVSDTGVGIAAEHLPRIFERFYRVDRARSRATGGTGLGLALVRNIAERWGGTVDIASEVGVGTTVTLRLPRA